MERRALIIFCDSTRSGKLTGPSYDSYHYQDLLQSSLGGEWQDFEILPLHNPTILQVSYFMQTFMAGANYTFIVFTGHGFIFNGLQYLELSDGNISIYDLKSDANRQLLIIDACRNHYQSTNLCPKFPASHPFGCIGDVSTTRTLFDRAIRSSTPGWTVLYAATTGQSAVDTNNGGAYSLSLLALGKAWENRDDTYNILSVDVAHKYAKIILQENFYTNQTPVIHSRIGVRHFPLFVKYT